MNSTTIPRGEDGTGHVPIVYVQYSRTEVYLRRADERAKRQKRIMPQIQNPFRAFVLSQSRAEGFTWDREGRNADPDQDGRKERHTEREGVIRRRTRSDACVCVCVPRARRQNLARHK